MFKRSNAASLIPFVLILALLVTAFAAGTAVVSTRADGAAQVSLQVAPTSQPDPQTLDEQRFTSLYQQVAQSVVSIGVIARQGTVNPMFEDQFAEGTGTGMVIDNQGHILTNYHVIQGAVRIEINFFDGRIVRAEIVAEDPDSDLAVLRVSDVPAEALQPVTFGDSSALFVGQEVVAIGSPFNQPWTMTSGIVSALGRTIQGLSGYSIGAVIQTDAAINPGNSGGPLFNLNGEVIGINSQIISRSRSSSGVGFAVPSNLAVRVAEDLIETGDVSYSYMGIGGNDINLYFIDALGIPNDTRGVVVTEVQPNSPAAAAGLRSPANPTRVDGVLVPTQADIITAIDGTPINGFQALIGYLAINTEPGQTVQLSVLRSGETVTVPLTLAVRPPVGS